MEELDLLRRIARACGDAQPFEPNEFAQVERALAIAGIGLVGGDAVVELDRHRRGGGQVEQRGERIDIVLLVGEIHPGDIRQAAIEDLADQLQLLGKLRQRSAATPRAVVVRRKRGAVELAGIVGLVAIVAENVLDLRIVTDIEGGDVRDEQRLRPVEVGRVDIDQERPARLLLRREGDDTLGIGLGMQREKARKRAGTEGGIDRG